MPPMQCPECGRSLSTASIASLNDGDASCPDCEATVAATMVAEDQALPLPTGGSTHGVSADVPDVPDEVSVRPPDLEPDAVRDRESDVLAGWDIGVGDDEIAAWRRDRRPFPTDTVVVAGAGAAGLLLGLALDPEHRVRGASAGLLSGVVGSAVTRRVWLLRS